MRGLLQILVLVCACLVSCDKDDLGGNTRPETPPTPPESPGTPEIPGPGGSDATPEYGQLINKTEQLPDEYTRQAGHRGQVVRIDYDTKDYAEGIGAARRNTAYVYVPYGYSGSGGARYNTFYFVHGHYGTAASLFNDENGLVVNVLDHMVEEGKIAPAIIVSASYNYGVPTPNYVDADPYCAALPYELVADLIPVVESRYGTYISGTDAAGLESARDHRAIGGFSMGAVTTWYAFAEMLPYFRYYMPVSGDCWSLGAFAGMNRPDETAEYLARIAAASGYGSDGFYIWAASGTSDSAYSETLVQVRAMSRITDVFPLSSLTFHEKDGARHEFRPVAEYLYNALPFFFPPGN